MLDLIWFGFMASQPLKVILCQTHFYTYKQYYFKVLTLSRTKNMYLI